MTTFSKLAAHVRAQKNWNYRPAIFSYVVAEHILCTLPLPFLTVKEVTASAPRDAYPSLALNWAKGSSFSFSKVLLYNSQSCCLSVSSIFCFHLVLFHDLKACFQSFWGTFNWVASHCSLKCLFLSWAKMLSSKSSFTDSTRCCFSSALKDGSAREQLPADAGVQQEWKFCYISYKWMHITLTRTEDTFWSGKQCLLKKAICLRLLCNQDAI